MRDPLSSAYLEKYFLATPPRILKCQTSSITHGLHSWLISRIERELVVMLLQRTILPESPNDNIRRE